jgi:hypothetical protein
MIEQNQQTFGQIVRIGYQELFVIMVIKIAIINLHLEEAKQVRKVERIVTIDPKYLENYV